MNEFPIEWGAVNTALIIAALTYLYKQARVVDQVKQALTGLDGKGGVIEEIKILRERSHQLSNVMQTLQSSVEHLTEEMAALRIQKGRA